MGMLNKPDTWKHAQYLLGTFFSFLSQVALVSRTNVRSWDPNVRCRPLWPPLTLPLLPCLTAACQRPKCQPCAQQCTASAFAASKFIKAVHLPCIGLFGLGSERERPAMCCKAAACLYVQQAAKCQPRSGRPLLGFGKASQMSSSHHDLAA